MDRVDARPAAEALEHDVPAIGARPLEALEQALELAVTEQCARVELAAAHRLGERLLEGAADRHHLADALHVRREDRVGATELLEGEARALDDDVVDRRLEARRRAHRDVVRDLLERVADRQARGDLRDREPGRLRGQRRGARDARVHLDDEDLLGLRVDRELDVGAAGLHADRADDGHRLVAQLLVEVVGERLLRGDGDAVARMHAHRVEVLDRADDHAVVVAVAHDLELELAPPEHGLVEQHLPDRRRVEAAADDLAELLLAARDAPAAPAEGERGPHDRGQADRGEMTERLLERGRDPAARHLQAGRLHRLAEALAVLGPVDRLVVGADQLDAVALERAVLGERLGEVQRRLPPERRQQGVRALLGDDLGDGAREQRLDIGRVGELRVGHDRRRVRVHEDDLVALLAQDLAGLHPGVVELGRLPDHDRARPDDQDLVEVVAPGHQARTCSRKRSKR